MKSLINRWEEKYYEFEADEFVKDTFYNVDIDKLSEEEVLDIYIACTKHSINKWIGINELDKFNEVHARNFESALYITEVFGPSLFDENSNDSIPIDSDTCSLCIMAEVFTDHHHKTLGYDNIDTSEISVCDFCPLQESFPEDEYGYAGCEHTYNQFYAYSDPEPMLQKLFRLFARLVTLKLNLPKKIPVVNLS